MTGSKGLVPVPPSEVPASPNHRPRFRYPAPSGPAGARSAFLVVRTLHSAGTELQLAITLQELGRDADRLQVRTARPGLVELTQSYRAQESDCWGSRGTTSCGECRLKTLRVRHLLIIISFSSFISVYTNTRSRISNPADKYLIQRSSLPPRNDLNHCLKCQHTRWKEQGHNF